jgi:hypothetical protein
MIITDKTIIKQTLAGNHVTLQYVNDTVNISLNIINANGGIEVLFEIPAAGSKELSEMLFHLATVCGKVEVLKQKPGRKTGFKLKPVVPINE